MLDFLGTLALLLCGNSGYYSAFINYHYCSPILAVWTVYLIWMGQRNIGFVLRRWADNPGKKTWKRDGSQIRLIRTGST